MDRIFCKTCHRFISWYKQDKDGTQLYRNGKPVGAKFSGNTFVINGKKLSGYPVQCQVGHPNFIQDTEEQKLEQQRLRFNFGKPCVYHEREGVTCNQRTPCTACIVYKNVQITKDIAYPLQK